MHFPCELLLPPPAIKPKGSCGTQGNISGKIDRSKIVGDIEALANLFWRLALLNVLRDCLACQIKKIFHIQKIGRLQNGSLGGKAHFPQKFPKIVQSQKIEVGILLRIICKVRNATRIRLNRSSSSTSTYFLSHASLSSCEVPVLSNS